MDPTSQALLGLLPGTTSQVDPSSAYPIAGQAGSAQGTGSGTYGLQPVLSGAGTTVSGAIVDLWDWLNTPFKRPLSATTIFGIVGAILISLILWNLILYHVRIAAESI